MKKLISLLLVSAMLVSFTACAGGSTSDVPPDTTIETGQNANELTEETDRVIETGQDADGLTAEIDTAWCRRDCRGTMMRPSPSGSTARC